MKRSSHQCIVRAVSYKHRQFPVRYTNSAFLRQLHTNSSATTKPSLLLHSKNSNRALSTTPSKSSAEKTNVAAASGTRTTLTSMSLQIRAIQESDSEVWKSLWEQYNQFYKRTIPAEVTETTLTRFLDSSVRMYCAVAVDSETSTTIGFVTWYPHPTTSSIQEIVYLQDLFVNPNVRNKGTGRALIEHVYEHAKTIPVNSVYWNTQYFNYVGQILYNKVASRTDFIRYQKNF